MKRLSKDSFIKIWNELEEEILGHGFRGFFSNKTFLVIAGNPILKLETKS